MNAWQMSNRAPLGKFVAGSAVDQGDRSNGIPPRTHSSIHPHGRSDSHKAAQRRHRAKMRGQEQGK